MKAQCLPFSQIPHTTRLFTDFLSYSPQVQPFYPHSPNFREWMKGEAAAIGYDAARRERVATILERQNKSWDASPQTMANLERLRKGAAAVVTGQQVGLFGGPTFSIYKALTAVKLAEEATAAGIECVPVFWLATYDHDLAEINHVGIPGADGLLQTLATTSHGQEDVQVGSIKLDSGIAAVVAQAAELLGESEATKFLQDSYRDGETMGSAFARLCAKLFAEWGVILLDGADPDLHRVAQPIYRAAIERDEELADQLMARGSALEKAGYHQQVKVGPSSVLAFIQHNGARTSIHRRVEGNTTTYGIGSNAAAEKISRAELLSRVESAPELFTPNVLLRPVVEDYLLPTLAYTGGAAEAAYFAQAGVVYQALLGRVTPIVPRFSATLVPPKLRSFLDSGNIHVTDVFTGPDALRQKIATQNLPQDLKTAFDDANRALDGGLSAIREKLTLLDRTLVDAAETAGSKMKYQLERLYTQAARAESQKGEVVARKADKLSNLLYPDKGLQERGIGGIYFAAKYGMELLHQLHDAIHTNCHDHQILDLDI